MTVNTSNITSGPYDGNGSNKDFSFSFRADDASQISVYVKDVNNVITTKTLTTDYTVSGLGVDAGGTVSFVTAPASTDDVYIRSNYQDTQLTDFDSQGGFFPDVHESAFDKLTFLVQQLKDEISRCVRIDVDDLTGAITALGQLAPNSLLRVNGTGDGFEQVTLTSTGVTAEIALTSYATFRDNIGFTVGDYADGQVIWFTDAGIAGAFVLRTGATPADDGGTIIRSNVDTNRYVERSDVGSYDVKWFEAAGSGSGDDLASLQSAITAGLGNIIFVSDGTYPISDELLIPFTGGSSTQLVGSNRNSAKISLEGVSNKAAIRLSASNCTIRDIGIAGDSGETGNTALRIAPEDETQTGTRVGQSYNIIRDIDISGTFDEGITLKTGPDVGGPDSDCYHNEIYKIRFNGDINVGVRIRDSNEAAGSASNRNWIFKCYFSGSMNVGVWNEGADTTWISDNSFEGVDNGTSPKTTPTAIVVENTAPTTGSSNLGVVLFNNRFENCTRHIENNNIRTQIIGGNHDRTKCYFAAEGGADPLLNIGGYDYSLNTSKMPGYKFQTNSQEAIPNSSPVFDNGIFLLSTETRMKYYREGTFTPFIADNSGSDSEGQTYTTQVGRYTLIGTRCFFDIRLAVSSLGTLTTSEGAQIGGLPFTAKNASGYQAAVDCGNASSLSITVNESVSGYIAGNTTLIVMRNWNATTGVSALLLSEVTATGQLTLSGSYEIDSV